MSVSGCDSTGLMAGRRHGCDAAASVAHLGNICLWLSLKASSMGKGSQPWWRPPCSVVWRALSTIMWSFISDIMERLNILLQRKLNHEDFFKVTHNSI